MLINGKQFRCIWLENDKLSVNIIDQRFLPHQFIVENIKTVKQMETAIKDMHLRGAPLIGAAAGFGMYLACLESREQKDFNQYIQESADVLENTRPTAVNLKWALERQMRSISKENSLEAKINIALKVAKEIADEDVEICRQMGFYAADLIEEIYKQKNKPVQVLTHCNAGALATVDIGTATSGIYEAAKRGIPLHVWVDETRPRNQGKLTSWELTQNNISNTVICDNSGGHLMQHNMVDMVIVGTDRTTANGDAANKIGTYLKALAAYDNHVPFYVALPSTTIDWTIEDGIKGIPIEERDMDEVLYMEGFDDGQMKQVRLFGENTNTINYGFDVTPARLITAFITEKGVCVPEKLKEFFGIYVV